MQQAARLSPDVRIAQGTIDCPVDLIYRGPASLAPGTSFVENNVFKDRGWGVVRGCSEHSAFIVQFIPVLITSAPPRITRH